MSSRHPHNTYQRRIPDHSIPCQGCCKCWTGQKDFCSPHKRYSCSKEVGITGFEFAAFPARLIPCGNEHTVHIHGPRMICVRHTGMEEVAGDFIISTHGIAIIRIGHFAKLPGIIGINRPQTAELMGDGQFRPMGPCLSYILYVFISAPLAVFR